MKPRTNSTFPGAPALALALLAAACTTPAPDPDVAASKARAEEIAALPWTKEFQQQSILMADEVNIEGPPGLIAHVAIKQLPDQVYAADTVEEGFLQQVSVPENAANPIWIHLDNLAIGAIRRARVLERPTDGPVVVRARGTVTWKNLETGEERITDTIELPGRAPAVKALAAALLVLAACGSTGIDAYGDLERSPSALEPALLVEARAARAAFDAGDFAGARTTLEGLCARAPKDLGLAILLQEAELAGGADAGALRERALATAREKDDARSWLLAARLETDTAEARAAIERAAAHEPLNAWAPYARAFVEARDGAWGDAQVHLQRALELDPAHLPARRLEAALLARDGKLEEAIESYEAWLEVSQDDPRVDPVARLAAALDLALVELEAGEPRAARDRLADLPVQADAQGLAARQLCLIAATEQSLGHHQLALDAAQGAEAAAPESALPKVQQAMLHEEWLADPEAAKAAWRRVISEARTSGDLGDLIQSMRARVVIERMDAAPAKTEP